MIRLVLLLLVVGCGAEKATDRQVPGPGVAGDKKGAGDDWPEEPATDDDLLPVPEPDPVPPAPGNPRPDPDIPDSLPDPSGDTEKDGDGAKTQIEPQTTACIKDTGAGLARQVRCSNINFRVSVPDQCVSGGCGLIFDVHGWTMDGRLQEQNTGLARQGMDAGYVVVQPDAPGRSWNRSHYPGVHDFMQQAKKAWAIDTDRVHFSGFSQGSMMTWYFICHHGDELASAAPITYAGGGECFGAGKANPVIPVLYHHGKTDGFSSFANAQQSRDRIVEGHGMKKQDETSGNRFVKTTWKNTNGMVLETIFHEMTTSPMYGSGHCFPDPPDQTPYGCVGQSDYSWGEEVIRFFENHQRGN